MVRPSVDFPQPDLADQTDDLARIELDGDIVNGMDIFTPLDALEARLQVFDF
ncbi:hypothetical protein U8C43_03045 (plasmid) [Sinorhizobium meliloti]|nr:hypothetical protein Q1M62_02800 [Sinorhizobium meliloti]WQP10632.1 hypothetical protein U8C30_03060 [Sinorhizobium meliloti]WQP24096.1 hypothetical protein U8C43_03045 [Sinorhizobium meliloti]